MDDNAPTAPPNPPPAAIIGPTHAGKAELARIAGIAPGEFLKVLRCETNENPYPPTHPHPWKLETLGGKQLPDNGEIGRAHV